MLCVVVDLMQNELPLDPPVSQAIFCQHCVHALACTVCSNVPRYSHCKHICARYFHLQIIQNVGLSYYPDAETVTQSYTITRFMQYPFDHIHTVL
jgi:hypothetical protein